MAVGVCYTLLKARALGDLAVFLELRPARRGRRLDRPDGPFSWLPVLWTVPMALLVIAILHANNWRDIRSDGERRVKTVAGLLGDRGSLAYYGCLVFAPFVIDLAFIAVPRLAGGPRPPHAADVPRRPAGPSERPPALGPGREAAAPRRPMDFIILDGATANHNLVFGLLSTAAVVLEGFLRWG